MIYIYYDISFINNYMIKVFLEKQFNGISIKRSLIPLQKKLFT